MAKSKAKEPPATPPSAKKHKRAQQPTLNAFFASPNGRLPKEATDTKSAAGNHTNGRKRKLDRDHGEVINVDSESDGFEMQDGPVGGNAEAGPGPSTLEQAERRLSAELAESADEDGKLARRLAREEGWDADGDGTGKDLSQTSNAQASGEGQAVNNGHRISPMQEATPSIHTFPKAKPPIANMFLPASQRAKREPTPGAEVDIKPATTPLKSVQPEPVAYVSLHDLSAAKPEPDTDDSAQHQQLDFDVDILMFRPEVAAKRIKPWPGGRLPYEVLVQVYMAVGGTRSRLAIVRMLTK